MQKNGRTAQSAKRVACLVVTSCAKRCAPWVPLLIFVLTAASGCSYPRPHFSPAELSQRLQYGHDQALEELVEIAMGRGYQAVNGSGRPRQVLELDMSGSGHIHRQFFEVQPWDESRLEVFFLENKGTVNDSKLSRFPRHLRKEIRKFLQGLPVEISTEYKPLRVRQEKLSRRMIICRASNSECAVQFTQNVVSIEGSNLYGLYHFPDGPFVFFGQESEDLFRKDFLEADERYNELVRKFLRYYQPEIKL